MGLRGPRAKAWRGDHRGVLGRANLAAFLFFMAAIGIVYTVTLVYAPIAVMPSYLHDDGFYMRLGAFLARGHWLGPFSQFTLMKGPGYPVFLAIANHLRISVTLAHALFHCTAVIFFTAIAYRLTRSAWLCTILFLMLLWHPLSFTQPMLRVFRDAIYYAQVLIFLAALTYALLGAKSLREKLIYAALSGIVLGWLWLTREEGAWLLPGLAVLATFALIRAFRADNLAPTVSTLMTAAGLFAAVQVGFQTANYLAYGKFVGVDFKERNFQHALNALSGVESGGTRPFISVTRAARKHIYAFSPAFESLRPYFESVPGKQWTDLSCRAQPETCGEIGAGFFVWALRDAAEKAGHYASPQAASEFFGRMADEILAACTRGLLVCNPSFLAEMPHLHHEQLSRIPQLYLLAARMLLLRGGFAPEAEPSSGDSETLEKYMRFLHEPLRTPSSDRSGFTLLGWYYRSGGDWFSARVTSHAGAAGLEMRRMESPDIAQAFHDEKAGTQRFNLKSDCVEHCVLELSTQDGTRLTLETTQLRSNTSFPLAGGTIHFDSAERHLPVQSSPLTTASADLRRAISEWYGVVLVPFSLMGLAAFAASSVRYLRASLANVCYLIAVVLWVLILTRVSLLVLIAVTSFNALLSIYLGPTYFLLVAAAFFSVRALVQVARPAGAGAPAAGLVDTHEATP